MQKVVVVVVVVNGFDIDAALVSCGPVITGAVNSAAAAAFHDDDDDG